MMKHTRLLPFVIFMCFCFSSTRLLAQKEKDCDIDFLPGLWARVSVTKQMPADSTLERLKKIEADTTFITWDIQRDLSAYIGGQLYGRTLKTQVVVTPKTCKFSFGKEPGTNPVNMKEILEINRKVLYIRSYNSKGVPEYLYFLRIDWR